MSIIGDNSPIKTFNFKFDNRNRYIQTSSIKQKPSEIKVDKNLIVKKFDSKRGEFKPISRRPPHPNTYVITNPFNNMAVS